MNTILQVPTVSCLLLLLSVCSPKNGKGFIDILVNIREEKSSMPLLMMLVLSATDDGGKRVILFILLMVAVALILAGAIIALLTLYNQKRTQAIGSDKALGE
jgi:hypothetical protein